MKEITSRAESIKLWADYCKHLASLATGSIVLMAAFIDKTRPHSAPFGMSRSNNHFSDRIPDMRARFGLDPHGLRNVHGC